MVKQGEEMAIRSAAPLPHDENTAAVYFFSVS